MKKLSVILVLILTISLVPTGTILSQANSASFSVAPQFLDAVQIENPVAYKNDSDTVTRAEALTVFVRLFGYSADSSANVPFGDVDDSLSGELKYALDLGMISSADNFRPKDAITYNEAIKMCVVALGYDYLAKAYGGWPVGYIKIASDVNLSGGLSLYENTITKSNFYLMIENLLTSQMLKLDGVVDDEISYRRYTTVLDTYFDMYESEGIVTANEYTGLYSHTDANDKGYISINEYPFNYIGNMNYIGYNVKGYAYKKNDKIALVVPYQNVTKTVDFKDMVLHSGTTFTYDVGEKEAKLRLEAVLAVIYNGKSDENIKLSSFAGKNGYFTFVDNDNDNVYEVCEVHERRTVVVSGINAVDGYISDKNGEKRINLSDDECTYFVYDNGAEVSIADIKAGTLLSCYVSADELYTRIEVESGSVNGVITGFNTAANIIEIDNTQYCYSNYFKNHYLSKLKTGDEIAAMTSSTGLIEAALDAAQDGIYFGYLMDVTKGSGIDDSIKVKLVTSGGVISVFDVYKRLTVDGTNYSNTESINNVFFKADGTKKMSEQLVRYKLTSDGMLTLLDTEDADCGYISKDDPYENNLKRYAYPDNSSDLIHDGIWLSSTTCIVHPWYSVTEDTFIIQINSDTSVDEEKRFVVRNLSWLKSNRNITRSKLSVYNVDEYCVAGALVFDTAADDKVTDDSPLGVVHSVTKALNSDLIESYKLVIYKNGYYYDYFVTDQEVVNKYILDKSGNIKIGNGDFVRYESDNNGTISVIEVDYDASEKKLIHKNTNQMYLCYYYGGVYSVGNGFMTLLRAAEDGVNLDIGHQRYVFRIPSSIMIHDSATGEITTGTADDLETYLQVGEECTRIMVITDDLTMRSCIIYR